jgi:protein subunit release factor A
VYNFDMSKITKPMTNSELFDDMKQFMRAEISGAVSMLTEEFDEKLDLFKVELMNHTDEVAQEIMSAMADAVMPKLDNHEERITTLEIKSPKGLSSLRHRIA